MNVDAMARQRIETLLGLAKKMWRVDKLLSRRYVRLARKIAARHRIKLGNKLFCKKCNAVFIPGRTLRVRQSPKHKTVLYVCLECGSVRKFGYG